MIDLSHMQNHRGRVDYIVVLEGRDSLGCHRGHPIPGPWGVSPDFEVKDATGRRNVVASAILELSDGYGTDPDDYAVEGRSESTLYVRFDPTSPTKK